MSRNRKQKLTSGPSTKGQTVYLPLSTDANPANGVTIQGPDSVGVTPLVLTLPSSVVLNGVVKSDASGNLSNSLVVDANISLTAAIALGKLAALTNNKAVATNGSGVLVPSTTSDVELGYVTGVTSAIQTQINNKQDASTAATLTGTQTLTNKTLTSPIINTPETDIVLVDEQSSTPATPASGKMKFYSKTDNNFYTLNSSGTETKIGSGSGGINYITNSSAESDTSGWAAYSNTAQNIPVNATGGTATGLTFSRSTSSPLIGTGSFLMAQANSTSLQGKGVSYDYTIDSAFQASVLGVSFNYNASSTFVTADGITAPKNDGTTSTNAGNSDVEVFMYDITNAILIPVTPQVISGKGSNNYKFVGTFQTASNSLSYRLIFHVATANANATGWNFKFDNVVVGPQVISNGSTITDWQAYTPTFVGFGTPSAVNFQYRRVGGNLEIDGYFTAGTTTATPASFTFPTGLVAASTLTSLQIVGQHGSNTTGVTANTTILAGPSATVFNFGFSNSTGGDMTAINGSAYSTGTTFSVQAMVPITGWSSNVVMSNDTDTRVVAAQYAIGTGASTANAVQINFDTKVVDTHGAVTTGVGAWKFTAPVSGIYNVSCNILGTVGVINLKLYKNSALYLDLATCQVSEFTSSSTLISLVSGDVVDLRPDATFTPIGGSAPYVSFVSINRLSGPAAIAATDSVNCRYHGSVSTITSALANITYTTSDFDTHGAYASGTYTVPTSGVYNVRANVSVTATTVAAGNAAIMQVNKNGSAYANSQIVAGAATSKPLILNIDDLVKCVAGDTITVQVSFNGTTPSITSSNTYNFLAINKVGNG